MVVVRGPLFCLVGAVEGGIILKAPNPDYRRVNTHLFFLFSLTLPVVEFPHSAKDRSAGG